MSRPMEDRAWAAQMAAEAEVSAQCAAGNTAHEAEVMSHHQGQPSVAVQDRTHGAPAPAVDTGVPAGSVI